jgi:hypothetical protein
MNEKKNLIYQSLKKVKIADTERKQISPAIKTFLCTHVIFRCQPI